MPPTHEELRDEAKSLVAAFHEHVRQDLVDVIPRALFSPAAFRDGRFRVDPTSKKVLRDLVYLADKSRTAFDIVILSKLVSTNSLRREKEEAANLFAKQQKKGEKGEASLDSC